MAWPQQFLFIGMQLVCPDDDRQASFFYPPRVIYPTFFKVAFLLRFTVWRTRMSEMSMRVSIICGSREIFFQTHTSVGCLGLL